MRNFQDTFETHKPSFISALSIYMTVPLNFFAIKLITRSSLMNFSILSQILGGVTGGRMKVGRGRLPKSNVNHLIVANISKSVGFLY